MSRALLLTASLMFSLCACGPKPRNPNGYACEYPAGDRCSEFTAQSQAVVQAGGFSRFAPSCSSQGGSWKRGGCTTRALVGTCEAPEGVVHFVYERANAGLANMIKSTCGEGTWRDRQAP